MQINPPGCVRYDVWARIIAATSKKAGGRATEAASSPAPPSQSSGVRIRPCTALAIEPSMAAETVSSMGLTIKGMTAEGGSQGA